MNKKYLLSFLYLLLSITSYAQKALPYKTGFDNATETAGWLTYRNGETDFQNWNLNSNYMILPSSACPSSPDCMVHDYPEGTSLTDDWLISPSLDMTKGGSASLKIYVFSMMINTSGGTLAAGDAIEMYLLTGSADPTKATKTLLATFDANGKGVPNNTFRDSNNIAIAPTSGDAHLAFRYTCINDWFQIGIDDIQVAPGTATGLSNVKGANAFKAVYPNPAKDVIYWKSPFGDPGMNAAIYNVTGQVIAIMPSSVQRYDVHELAPGMYFLKIGNAVSSFTKD